MSASAGRPILVAGLSPAWQQILTFDALRLGEVNRARESAWCASGKAPNVGLALHRLGASARTLSVLGGAAGDSIAAEFAALQAPCRWVRTEAATRVCTTLLAGGVTTELVENARPISPAELAAYRAAFAEEALLAETLVLTGSLPAGVPAELFRDLLGQFRGRAILDVRGPELEAALACRPWLVKPNREELAATVQRPLTTDADLHAAMRTLNERGAEWVVVTQGAAALWASSRGELWRFTPPAVAVVNPIGCGDSIAAGIAWGAAQDLPLPVCIRLGMAAAAENARELLPCRFAAERVRALAREIDGERVG